MAEGSAVSAALDGLGRIRWLRWSGLPWAARLIRRSMVDAMIGLGASFFSSRDALERRGSFDDLLGSASKVDAAFVTGHKIMHRQDQHARHIVRLILPNPQCESFLFYEQSVGESIGSLANQIIGATRECREKGIKVRWCPVILHQSFMLGDVDKPTGWLHSEMVLPYSKMNNRPSFRIYRHRFESAIHAYQDIFNKLWDASTEPPANLDSAPISAKALLLTAHMLPSLTDYDRDVRTRAVDDLLDYLNTHIAVLAQQSQTLAETLNDRVRDGSAANSLSALSNNLEVHIRAYSKKLNDYVSKYIDFDDRLRTSWNTWDIVESTIGLRNELNRLSEKPDVLEYLVNNESRSYWIKSVNCMNEWIVKTKKSLVELRRGYIGHKR